jgi:hypothetical protein
MYDADGSRKPGSIVGSIYKLSIPAQLCGLVNTSGGSCGTGQARWRTAQGEQVDRAPAGYKCMRNA